MEVQVLSPAPSKLGASAYAEVFVFLSNAHPRAKGEHTRTPRAPKERLKRHAGMLLELALVVLFGLTQMLDD